MTPEATSDAADFSGGVALFTSSLPVVTEPMLVASMRKGAPGDHIRTSNSGTTARTFLTELDEYVAAQVAKAKAEVLDQVRDLSFEWAEDIEKDPAYALWLTRHTDEIAGEAGLPRPTPTSEGPR